MKKLTAIIMTTVLLASAIQPVWAAYATDSTRPKTPPESSCVQLSQPQKISSAPSVTPDQASKDAAAQEEDFTFNFLSDEPYDKAYYSPDFVDNSGSIGYAGQNMSDTPITFSVSSSDTDILKITSGAKATVNGFDHFFEIVKYKINKVSGFDYDMKYNAFLALANRKSGKITFKWLTSYNPKTTSVTVGETRMVKLSDSRFAILYTTTQKGKSSLNYEVYSDAGQKVFSKKYSSMVFDGDSQPLLTNGNIVWISTTEKNGKTKTTLYSIPAAF